MADRNLVVGNLLVVASMAIWATGFPLAPILLEHWHPMYLAAVRLAAGAVFLIILMGLLGRLSELRWAPWRDCLAIGGLGLGMAAIFLTFGQRLTDPVVVAIIATMVPVISAIMGAFSGTERISARLMLAIALAVTGGVFAVGGFSGGAIDLQGGEILVLASTIGFTWFSRASVERLAHMRDLAKATATMMASALVVVAVALTVTGFGLIVPSYDFSATSLAQIFWFACIANAGAMALWFVGIRILGVTVGGMHQNLVPFYVMLMAVALGGVFVFDQLWAALLVILGTILAQFEPRQYLHVFSRRRVP